MHMLIPSKGSLKPVSAPKSRLLGKRTGITSLPSGMLLRILPRIPADGTSNRNHFSLDGIKFSRNLFLGGPYGTPIRHHGPHSPLNAFHFVCDRSSSYGAPSEIAKKSTPHLRFAFTPAWPDRTCVTNSVAKNIIHMSLRPCNCIRVALLRSKWHQTRPATLLDAQAPPIR